MINVLVRVWPGGRPDGSFTLHEIQIASAAPAGTDPPPVCDYEWRYFGDSAPRGRVRHRRDAGALELVRAVLAEAARPCGPGRSGRGRGPTRGRVVNTVYLSAEDVVRLAAHHFDVHVDELLGPSRCRTPGRQRVAAMAAARLLTRASMPEIGRAFGRHHTSVLNAIRRAERDELIRRLRDGLVRAVHQGDAASESTLSIRLSCRCGWESSLMLGGLSSIAAVAEAVHTLERAERDHRHGEGSVA